MAVDSITCDALRDYITKYYEKNNKMPKLDRMAGRLQITKYVLAQALRALVIEGFLNQNYNKYTLNPDYASKTDSRIVEDGRERTKDIVLVCIRICMLLIGTVAVCASVHFTGIWLTDFMKPVIAWGLSGIMVIFSVAAFEAIMIFKENQNTFLIIIFSILWLIVLCFSMISTIAGQYNIHIYKNNKKIESSDSKYRERLILDNMRKEEKEIEKQMTQKAGRLDFLNDLIINFDLSILEERANKKIYDSTIKEIHRLENEMRILRDLLSGIREKINQYIWIESSEIIVVMSEEKSFYEWIGLIFDISSDKVQFWLSVFPAVFVDIIAPLSFAIGMFLKRKKRKSYKKPLTF